MGYLQVVAVFCWSILLSVAVDQELSCYSCSSYLDSSCFTNPTTTTHCPVHHGRGCSTKITSDGAIERGCSDIGLSPDGCQISSIFGSECVCHKDKCNSGIPALPQVVDGASVECYQCDSDYDAGCNHDTEEYIRKQTCPAKNGCYYMKRIDGNGMIKHNRLCFNDQSPATYHPPGCYTVFNEFTSSNVEVCICYDDDCNKNRGSIMESAVRSQRQIVSSNSKAAELSHLISSYLSLLVILQLLT